MQVDDQMDGQGKYVRPDGSTYEGYWENNLQNGFGRLTLTNGDVYEGDFRDGKMDGYCPRSPLLPLLAGVFSSMT